MEHASEAVAEARPGRLLRERDYLAFLFGQGISAVGDAATYVALPVLVLLLTGSGLAMGVVGALQTAPDLVFGLPAGAYADRWDRRRVMIATDLGRALLTAAIPMAALLGLDPMPVVLLVVAPINILRVFFEAAKNASVPALAGRDRLNAAFGYLEALASLGYILGPALAGVLIAWVGAAATLGIDAASFVVSAAGMFAVRRSLRPAGPPLAANVRSDVLEGLRFVRADRVLRLSIGAVACFNVATAAFVPAFTFVLVKEHGFAASGVGLMLAIWSIGSVAGAIAAAKAHDGRNGLRMTLGATLSGGALVIAVSLPGWPAFAVFGLLAGLGNSVLGVSYVSLRTSRSPDRLLGRIASLARMVTLGGMPLGMLAGGLAIQTFGGTATIVGMGAAALSIGLVFGLAGGIRSAAAPAPEAAPRAA